MMTANMKLAAAAGLGLIAVLFVLQKKSLLAAAAAGAVGVAADASAGVVLGLGDVFGVPRTDAQRCAEAKAAGDLWTSSFYCTAPEFGSGLWQSAKTAAADAVLKTGDALGLPRTNESECQRALREGRTLDASFACDAGTFIKSFF